MARLVPMTASEFEIYLQNAVESYAQEHVSAGNWSPAEALQNSRDEYNQLLPDGVASPKQHLFMIEDSQTGVKVGLIWFAERPQASRPSAFIYDFLIYDEFRKKGYGTQALVALEEKVQELGLEAIALHVFGHNKNAIGLYQKVGYEITDLHMVKRVGP